MHRGIHHTAKTSDYYSKIIEVTWHIQCQQRAQHSRYIYAWKYKDMTRGSFCLTLVGFCYQTSIGSLLWHLFNSHVKFSLNSRILELQITSNSRINFIRLFESPRGSSQLSHPLQWSLVVKVTHHECQFFSSRCHYVA